MPKNRIESFSDGVFAIAITLTVFQFKIPTNGHGLNSTFYFMLLTYATSFLLVTSFWISHHYELSLIKKVDTAMLWINNLTLFPITLLPFTTTYHGLFPNSRQAALAYSINYGFIIIGLFVLGVFVYRRLDSQETLLARHWNQRRIYLSLGWCIPAIVLSYFFPWTATFTTLTATIFWSIQSSILRNKS